MKKIISFLGYPRKNDSTAKVIEQVIAGAKSEGMQVISYYLNDNNIRVYQGYRWCCTLNDDLAGFYEQLKEAEDIVIGSPIYFMNITSQTKKIMNRLYLVRKDDGDSNLLGKKFVTVYTQGNSDKEMLKSVIDANNQVFKSFQWDMIDSILYCGAVNTGESVAQNVMHKAFEAGRKLAG